VDRPEGWVAALERFADISPGRLALVRWDGTGDAVVEWVNAAAAELLGFDAQDLVGRPISLIYPPEQADEVLQRYAEARERGMVTYEVVRELPSGRRTLSATTVRLGGDRYLAQVVDRTDEREAQRRLDQVTTLTGAGFYHWNVVEEHSTWSEELFRLFGYEPGEVVPGPELYLEHVHPDDRAQLAEATSAARQGGEAVAHSRHRIVRRGGEVRMVDVHAQLGSDEAGTMLYALGVVRDVTDEVELERQAELVRRAAEQQRTALQVHDRIVQSLSTVVLALDLDDPATARSAAMAATASAQALVADLLGEVAHAQGGVLQPGALRTAPPAPGA
jgi:PAS domain S-box-containing protein